MTGTHREKSRVKINEANFDTIASVFKKCREFTILFVQDVADYLLLLNIGK